jgi:hypothetical protein
MSEAAADLLRPVIPQLALEYLRIMDDIENDAVLTSLQV